MSKPIQEIEQICVKVVTLLEALGNCLVLEREGLMNVNVDYIWFLHKEKQRIVKSIKDAGQEIKNIKEMAYPDNEIPVRDRRRLNDLFHQIAGLKEEVQGRVRENASLIQGSLDVFDELISLFFKGGRCDFSYTRAGPNQEQRLNVLFHEEA